MCSVVVVVVVSIGIYLRRRDGRTAEASYWKHARRETTYRESCLRRRNGGGKHYEMAGRKVIDEMAGSDFES